MNNVQQYKTHCRPKLTELLQALKLDKTYSRAEGNYLQTDSGEKILDLVGGFGCTILGHNHPEIVAEAISALAQGVAINAQGSIRKESAQLAQRLSELTGHDHGYLTNFSNSGTESVEAAIKHAYKIHFIGSSTQAIEGEQKNIPYYNYYFGKDSSKWVNHASAYAAVVYNQLYPHIDLKIYQKEGSLKYDFKVNPGGKPQEIKLQIDGSKVHVLQ